MEHTEVELGMKVVPSSKSYAQALHNSQEWKRAKELYQDYLYVNYAHPSHKFGKVYVLGQKSNSPNGHAGDFFLVTDFEKYEEDSE